MTRIGPQGLKAQRDEMPIRKSAAKIDEDRAVDSENAPQNTEGAHVMLHAGFESYGARAIEPTDDRTRAAYAFRSGSRIRPPRDVRTPDKP